ncbi:MAG: N-acetyltransferase, partial [Paracoccaceae bacterium]|nr:N-acetyltransferase [Paracoccaceae bacterium]
MTFDLRHGLPEALRADAAAIYWQAFGGKLGRLMGPKPKALAFLRRAIRADHCIVALNADGTLLGLAGFKTPQGAFAAGEMPDMRAIYGFFGASWRAAILWLLEREVDNSRFLLDGICVAQGAR